MKYNHTREGLGFITNSLYVSSNEVAHNVYQGSLKGVDVKVKFKDDEVYVSNYCTKCGEEFFYLYNRGKPQIICHNCKTVNKTPEVVGEIEINGKIFIKYSNGVIRPK